MQNRAQSAALLTDRLFSRLIAIYGAQKVGAMWSDADIAEVKGVWAQAIARFEPATIGAAVGRLIDSGSSWPPTLPEFVELCRQCALGRRQAAGPALPPPGQAHTDVETAKRRVADLLAEIASKRPPSERTE